MQRRLPAIPERRPLAEQVPPPLEGRHPSSAVQEDRRAPRRAHQVRPASSSAPDRLVMCHMLLRPRRSDIGKLQVRRFEHARGLLTNSDGASMMQLRNAGITLLPGHDQPLLRLLPVAARWLSVTCPVRACRTPRATPPRPKALPGA